MVLPPLEAKDGDETTSLLCGDDCAGNGERQGKEERDSRSEEKVATLGAETGLMHEWGCRGGAAKMPRLEYSTCGCRRHALGTV